jgi:Lrp/AsnC family leucine-responsive transcriptional regulator
MPCAPHHLEIRSHILPVYWNFMPKVDLSDADCRLLRALQRNGRASTQDLAEASGLSSSPAWRRIKRLEDLGVIARHVALLDRHKLGLTVLAYVQVSLTDHTEPTVSRFDAFVQGNPHIMECARVTGGFDYIIKVVAQDAEGLEVFLMRHLLSLGIVRTASTSFVLRQIKATTELPLDQS